MFVSLGSNIEPRRNLALALAELRRRFRVIATSPVYRTAPVGDADQPDFWNLAAEIDSQDDPAAVQAELRVIEAALGRRRDPARPYGPRTADLDLVLAADAVGRFGALELPSPLLEREAFVAVPVADLAPELRHPATAATMREIARAALAAAPRPPERLGVELSP